MGLNLIYGFNGQFSLGQWGFYALGAYAAADITYWWNKSNATPLVFGVLAVIFLIVAYVMVGRLIRQRLSYMDEMSRFAMHLLFTAAAVGLALGGAALLGGPVGALLGLLRTGSSPTSDASMQIAFIVATLCGGGLAALLSYLFGQPVLKLGGDYFGIATLGLTMVMYVLANNADSVFPEMKGARGMVGIPVVTTWFWVFVFLVLSLVAARNLLDSSHGRAIISVREDEVAARAMGIDVTAQKTIAFVIGSFLAGTAGSLYAHQEGFLHPSTFHFVKAFDPLIIIVFGGLGSVTGTLVGAFLWALTVQYLLPMVLPQESLGWRFVIYPVALLLIMLIRQEGLLGSVEWGFLKSKKWGLRARPDGGPPGSAAMTADATAGEAK
jgi:branched-chain amino acid transport system permease protein